MEGEGMNDPNHQISVNGTCEASLGKQARTILESKPVQKHMEILDYGSDDEIMTSDIKDGKSNVILNGTDPSISEEEINDILETYSSFEEKQDRPISENGIYHGETQPTVHVTHDENVSSCEGPNEDTKDQPEKNKLNSSNVVEKDGGAIANEQEKDEFHLKNRRDEIKPIEKQENSTQSSEATSSSEKVTENEQLCEQIMSDDNISISSNSETAVMISFPNGESYDLRDFECHSKIVKLSTEVFGTLEKLTHANSEKENEIFIHNKKISELNAHNKETEGKREKLEIQVGHLEKELEKSKEVIRSNHNAARTAIDRLHRENSEQTKNLKAQCLAMQKEKETAVMNFARREKEVMDAKRLADTAEKKAREAFKDKEKCLAQIRGLKMDLVKMKAAMEKKEAEAAQVKREMEKIKEDTGSHMIKVKWAQNKLKSETDAHSETKEKLAKALIEIKQAKEETEQIRKNCQGMIKTYQESEEMRSNSLDSKLKEKEMLLSQQEAKSGELEGIQKQQMDELRKLKQKHKDALEENGVMKTRVECLEKERLKNEETLKGYSEILNRQKKEAVAISEQLKEMDGVKGELEVTKGEVEKLKEALLSEQESKEQMWRNEEAWKIKEQELLEFTQRVSSKNAELTSECENLSSKLKAMSRDFAKGEELSSSQSKELASLKIELEKQKHNANDVTSELSRRLQDKETTVNQLTLQLDEVKDEIRTLKRKNNANIKDLTRQLQQARKRLEPYESASFPGASGPTTEDGSMGSRASSDTSLDCIGKTTANNSVLSHNSAVESTSLSSNSINGTADIPETVVTTTGEINKQALIERIVRLQRIHARKNEKIDFLQDHVQQLVDELQKKQKIIQHYILREESGMLMHEDALSHYVATDHTSKMPRHLSMEVNRKMQSVLEDTLLKNIALKESIEALGKEIARLSSGTKS